MIYGAMLAGGSGTRVKSSKIPKQFIEIGGKPIIIYTLENMLKVAVVLNKDQIQRDVVSLGTSVKVKIMEDGTEETALFQIVGSAEANPMEGRISDESPVGKALVGHRCGDKVNVETAYGITVYEILAVDMTGD